MSNVGSCQPGTIEGPMPYVVRQGVFGATVNVNEEQLFLRMELITEKNVNNWRRFKRMSCSIANDSRGILSGLVALAGKVDCPKYDDIKEVTGLTCDEYVDFIEEAIRLKNKTNNKIVEVLKANSTGINHMTICIEPERFVVYVSKNRHFSIQEHDDAIQGEECNLKSFINSYSDILVSVCSDFSGNTSFHNRGISRNPYWVFKEKYAGLSMLLHGFTGAVAGQFFPKKEEGRVVPIGSMQSIIKKSLLPGEGYMENMLSMEKIDLTLIEVSPNAPEGGMDHIKISALVRIYLDKVGVAKEKPSIP